MDTVARIVKRHREAKGMTQVELARLAGVSPTALAKAEAGIVGMGLDMALKVSRALGMSAGWLDEASAGGLGASQSHDRAQGAATEPQAGEGPQRVGE